ncbi:MAG TPA: hypothetical protein VLV83_01835 [Acidobacteriota bacterium]|nr:hypothetical protein [Acidobacteriota bacterium]
MSKTRVAAALAATALVLGSGLSVSSAQDRHPLPERNGQSAVKPGKITEGYRRTGHEIPKYVVVGAFFNVAGIKLEAGERNWARMLGRIGVQHQSNADRLLRDATAEALRVDRRTTDLTLYRNDPEMFERVQLEAVRRKVRELAQIYYGLRDTLEAEGVDLRQFDAFLEEKIRPTVSMVSFPTPDYELFEIMEEFEHHRTP